MIIGLHGKAGSGKDTACEFLIEFLWDQGIYARRDAFADRLKLSAAKALGYMPDSTEEAVKICNDLKTKHIVIVENFFDEEELTFSLTGEHLSGREYLQNYGTEAHRDVFDRDFWVDAVLSKYDAQNEILIVTDVRFPNEAEAIRLAGGEVWQILRPGNVDLAAEGHSSEQPLPVELVDKVIHNDGSLSLLENKLCLSMQAVMERG